MARQLRTLPGSVIGFDLGTALEIGAALGVPPAILAELLPPLESVLVDAHNRNLGTNDNGG